VLRGLDHHDSRVRCILMLALAVQLYYRPGAEPEIEALVDEGTAVARRLGDPALRGWAARAGWLALWRSATLERRHALAVEELEAAHESGDEAAQALGHIALAGTAVEEGDLETWLAQASAAEAIARRRRMAYVEFVLHFVRLNLALLEGDDSAAEAHAEAMRTMRDGIATPALEWTDFGVSYVTAMWRPEMADQVAQGMFEFYSANPSEIGQAPLLHVLALVGREDDVRAELATRPLQPMIDNWYLTADAGVRGIVAALLGDVALARSVVGLLRPATGRMAVSGISVVSGPVDGYLALALAVVGERAEATALADRAEALATRWGMVAYLRWFAERRSHLSF
jgi:hypothetical protein